MIDGTGQPITSAITLCEPGGGEAREVSGLATTPLKRMLVRSQAELLESRLTVEKLKLEILRFKRAKFGASSERLTELAQLEMLVEELESEQAVLSVDACGGALAEPGAPGFSEGESARTDADQRKRPATMSFADP